MAAVGATDPTRCVYVGDRLFDDIWGAHNAGLRAIHVPHSEIPAEQVGHSEGEPDAVAHELAEIPASSPPSEAPSSRVPGVLCVERDLPDIHALVTTSDSGR